MESADMGAGAGGRTRAYGQVDEEAEKLRARMTMPVMNNVTGTRAAIGIGCRTASFNPTQTSSITAATPGTSSSNGLGR